MCLNCIFLKQHLGIHDHSDSASIENNKDIKRSVTLALLESAIDCYLYINKKCPGNIGISMNHCGLWQSKPVYISHVLKHIHELNHDCMLTCHQTLIIAFISFPWGMHRQMPHERLQQLFFQRSPGKNITNNAMNIPTELHPCLLDMCLQKTRGSAISSSWNTLSVLTSGLVSYTGPLPICNTNQGTSF